MLDKLVRKNIKGFSPYKVQEYKDVVKLDANENNNLSYLFNEKLARAIVELKINEYPDSDCNELRGLLGEKFGLLPENILIGCGSDQLISVIVNTFIDPGDSILTFSPSFSMYSISTRMVGGKVIEIPLGEDFKFDYDAFIESVETQEAKVIFLCNPNNPTGGIISRKHIKEILDKAESIVVLDEAYIEFDGDSSMDLIEEYPNLIVLRTLSKAFGLAGARVGYGVASKELMNILYKVKPVYNVSSLSQMAAKIAIKEKELVDRINFEIKEEREKMFQELNSMENIKVYESHANFLLVEVNDSKEVFDYLLEKGFLVRYFGQEGPLANHIRISIGTKEDNQRVIQVIRDVVEGQNGKQKM